MRTKLHPAFDDIRGLAIRLYFGLHRKHEGPTKTAHSSEEEIQWLAGVSCDMTELSKATSRPLKDEMCWERFEEYLTLQARKSIVRDSAKPTMNRAQWIAEGKPKHISSSWR